MSTADHEAIRRDEAVSRKALPGASTTPCQPRPRELTDLIAEVRRSAFCVHPIRLSSGSPGVHGNRRGGQEIAVACRDRRPGVCPACAHTYAGDAYQVIATGLRGGKGVPASVASHPRAFVTLTAPSLGAVHSASRGPSDRLCHPRRERPVCPHGRAASCGERHSFNDPLVGEPLCPKCFDYPGAILFNAQVSTLWNATRIAAVRRLAHRATMTEKALRSQVRLSFFKAVEVQRRGLIHLHVIVRADGVVQSTKAGGNDDLGEETGKRDYPAPPEWVSSEMLVEALMAAAEAASIAVPGFAGREETRTGWGAQVDAHPFEAASTAEEVAAIARYTAKYCSKGSESSGVLARKVVSLIALERTGVSPHVKKLVRTAWEMGTVPELAALNLRDHAHTFGYRGYVSSKSRRYSTTLTALREARARFQAGNGGGDGGGDGDGGASRPTGGEPSWRYAGRGYSHPDADRLAARLAEVRRLRGKP